MKGHEGACVPIALGMKVSGEILALRAFLPHEEHGSVVGARLLQVPAQGMKPRAGQD